MSGQVNPDFQLSADDLRYDDAKKRPSSVVAISAISGDRQYKKNEHRRMLKNVLFTSISFMLLFTAFQSVAALQSSLFPDGLGNWSLTTVYAGLIVSSMFLPTIVIRHLTAKKALFLSMFGYIVYIGAQFYAEYYTVIPTAFLTGLCAAVLWSSKCMYLTRVGHEYAKLKSEDAEVIVVRFFGIFFFFFQSSSIWGNLISSLILGGSKEGNDPDICGANYCPWTELGNATLQDTVDDDTKKYTLMGVYAACALSAAIVYWLFVDSLLRYGEEKREGSATHLFLATFRHMKHPYQILLIPLTIWSGLEQGFFTSDFTAGYITCSWGVGRVGYVLICYGVADAISSVGFGPVIKKFGRIPVFILAAVINIAVCIFLLQWTPNPDKSYIFFIISALWGIADGIWQCEINAFYGVLFHKNEEAAFSNYRLWESIGFIIAYVNSNFICVDAKLYLLLGVIVIGMLGYFYIEIKERKNLRNSH